MFVTSLLLTPTRKAENQMKNYTGNDMESGSIGFVWVLFQSLRSLTTVTYDSDGALILGDGVADMLFID